MNMESTESTLRRMTAEEITEFVLGYCDKRILTDREVPDEMLGFVFMPIALGALDKLSPEDVADVALIWEYYSAASSRRAINGFPIMFSMRLMCRDDLLVVEPLVRKELERRKSLQEEVQAALEERG